MQEPFVLFLAALAFFHSSEFFLAALYNREGLGWRCEGAGRPDIAAAATAAAANTTAAFRPGPNTPPPLRCPRLPRPSS